MISFHNINSIAKYERTTLLRSWFFRIFGILSLLVLFAMNFGMVSEGGQAVWVYRALPSTIPYLNLLILNVAQAIIAVFLASDFLKRDKKLDTTEVIYMRSMTNGEYVIGKTWGNLQVFLVLNIIVLLMALIFNMLATATYVNWSSYALYILLISIPTLVFIMGLSFLLMSVIRNQAVTFILILGYIGLTLFLLKAKYYYLFDYMAFNIPMMKSDVVGLGNIMTILIHRGLYFSLGLGFIFLTIFLLKRLPQSEATTYLSIVFSVLFIGAGLVLGFTHINRFKANEKLRAESITLNSKYAGKPFADIKQNSISLTHNGQTFSAVSDLVLLNNNTAPIDNLIFNLNPGLTVSKVTVNGTEVKFTRENHLILVKPQVALPPDSTLALSFTYSGKITESICYLDVDNDTYTAVKKVENLLNIDKRFSFAEPDYLLLTPEVGWYPRTGVTFSPTNIGWIRNYFTDFRLEVKTYNSLQAVSQGKITEVSSGHFRFENEQPLTQISLALGKYKFKKIDTEGVQFGLWYLEGHDFFKDQLPDIQDTIPQIIGDRFKDLQRLYNLRFSFKRLSLVEVPAQFASFERRLISNQENLQPEQVLIPEKGFQMADVDFRRRIKREESFRKRSGETMTKEEYQVMVFNNFIGNFNSEQSRMDFRHGPMENMGSFQSTAEKANPYFIFPLLYGFQNSIRSDRWPITNRIFEAYLKSMNTDMRAAFMRNISGTNEDEMATISLQDSTFEEILADPRQVRIVDNVIKLKGDVLFSLIQLKAGDIGFENFIRGILNSNKFKTIQFTDFDKMVDERFGISLTPFMEKWFKEKSLPGFVFSPVKAVKVTDGEQIKTMVTLKVTNFTNTEGVIKLIFRLGGMGGGPGRGGGGMGRPRGGGGFGPSPNDMVNKVVELGPGQTKDLSYLLISEPRMVTINTLTSRNIPQMLMIGFPAIVEDPKAKPFDGETVSDVPVSMLQPNETILDNEDKGFSVTKRKNTSLLRRWITKDTESKLKYSGFNPWRPPVTWTATTNTDLYGKYVRSGFYIKSGDGSQRASWKVPIKDAAYYEVYYYVYKPRSFRHDEGPQKGEYHFIIHHDDGQEEQTLDIGGASNGWNQVGSYYFSPDTVTIELTDKSQLTTVFADAIKLVKQ